LRGPVCGREIKGATRFPKKTKGTKMTENNAKKKIQREVEPVHILTEEEVKEILTLTYRRFITQIL